MLGSLTLILLCQLLGESIAKLAKLPIPGPVLGMVLLFCALVFLPKRLPADLEATGGTLLRYLALLFVPAGVGVITHLDLLARSWAPIAGAVTIGTFITIAVTALVMQGMNRRRTGRQEEG